MCGCALRHLLAYRHYRVQRGHWLLEDHGDLPPPQTPKSLGPLSQQIDPARCPFRAMPKYLPCSLRRFTKQPHDR